MIEVFITDIQNISQAQAVSAIIQKEIPEFTIHYDFNETALQFPCGHTILRVEGIRINCDKIMETVRSQGFKCEILEDKICSNKEVKKEFWEEAFKGNQEMWGLTPAKSTFLVNQLFVENKVNSVLIPGIGYGRNAQIFIDNGMTVTGIEISETAIELGKKHFGNQMTIYHGSVMDMPFDNNTYNGIYCYGLIYLLDKTEREKLIQDCFNQLTENGLMVFTAITKDAHTYGKGTFISKDRYEMFGGVQIYFYDIESITEEFGQFGLFEISEVNENYPFYLIKCRKFV